ncbi:MAG: BolA family protein [Pseudomonadota bacterium]
MTLADRIHARLAALEPVSIRLSDDSHLHAGHAGAQAGGSHFSLHITSHQFARKNIAQRHRMIYFAVGELMGSEIHALTIQAHTPDEPNQHTQHNSKKDEQHV